MKNWPFDSFYFVLCDCEEYEVTKSRKNMDRFCGLVFKPETNVKIMRYYFFPKNDAYFV